MADPLFLGWLQGQSGRTDDVGALARATIDHTLDIDDCNSYVLNAALADARLEHRRLLNAVPPANRPPRRAASPSCRGCAKPVDERGITVLTRRAGVEDEGAVSTWHRACRPTRTGKPAPRQRTSG